MRVRQTYQSPLFAEIADVKAEEGKKFGDIAFVDQAETVKLREARYKL